ncbi:methyltransferase domain-containing protein [Intrasporangium sp.]|uniref:methyltransferase domain-containing protein n=1 Tax=Intrasporangium sp. TaxID=1925024 RepID=UPI00293AD8B3|nr:methyltransferase domain-containing protein [Intrasporangium sp.]MDV3221762.1 methyltransferase domain-containing protein [Intrasporangium sp.]
MASSVDPEQLTTKVQQMYQRVAQQPHGTYHFQLGRPLAVRLGYSERVLDRIPPGAVESFAGVGHFFDLAALGPSETVVDLGSGAGMDAFYAATLVGPSGRVIGIDFTPAQVEKARRLAADGGFGHVEFRGERIENPSVDDASADCIISNGVINLAADKQAVFDAAARMLRPGGRMAIADIVTERQLSDAIVGNAELWASCIGGAAQEDAYQEAIEAAGLFIAQIRRNRYEFLSAQAGSATRRYGVKSISVLAEKRGSS